MTTTEALLIGRRRRLALTMVGGFAGLVALSLAVAVVAERAGLPTAANAIVTPPIGESPGPTPGTPKTVPTTTSPPNTTAGTAPTARHAGPPQRAYPPTAAIGAGA